MGVIMAKRKVKRVDSFALNADITQDKVALKPIEWIVVLSVPLLMIVGIRYIAIFYVAALMLLIVGSYLLAALLDNRREYPKLHLGATAGYLLIATALTVVVYMIF